MKMIFRRKYVINDVSWVIIELNFKYASCVLVQYMLAEWISVAWHPFHTTICTVVQHTTNRRPCWSCLYPQLSNYRSYFYDSGFTLGYIIVDTMPWLHTIQHHVIHCKQSIAWHLLNLMTRTTFLFISFVRNQHYPLRHKYYMYITVRTFYTNYYQWELIFRP